MATNYSGRYFTVGDVIYFSKFATAISSSGYSSGSGKFGTCYGAVTNLYASSYNFPVVVGGRITAGTGGTFTGACVKPSDCSKGYQVYITYNANGGSNTKSGEYRYVGNSLTGSASRTGYTFAGWYTAASGGSRVTAASTGSTTYYAHWTANKYTVTLNQQGGSGGSTSVSATYASAMPAITKPTRTGYTFGGYYTSTNGGGTQYYTAAGASARSMGNAGAMTLYAKWTPNTYSIHFEGNGATTGSMSDQQFTYDQAQDLSQNGFGRGAAYRFAGWDENPNVDPRTETPTYTDSQSISNLRSENGAQVTLYAIWKLYYIAPEVTSEVVATRTAWSEESHSYVLDDQGTCFHIEFDWKVDQIVPTEVGTTNYIQSIVLKYKENTASAFQVLHVETFDTNMTSGSFKYDDPMNRAAIENTYDILIELTDTYGETIEVYGPQTVISAFVSKAFFTMDFAAGGYGIGVGTPAPRLPERGMNVAMDTTFINELNATLEYDDEDVEYYNGLNDRAVLSPGTIAKIESMLGLPESPFDYDPWWADPDSPVTLQNVANFISTFTPEHLTAEDFGLTTSTGTLTGFDAYRVGRIIHIQMSGQNSAAVSAGSNVYVGTVTNEKYWPIVPVSSSSYYGQYDFGIYFYSNNGQIVVRNNNYGQSSPASNHPGFGFTYIMAGQPNYEYTLPTDAGTNSGSSGGGTIDWGDTDISAILDAISETSAQVITPEVIFSDSYANTNAQKTITMDKSAADYLFLTVIGTSNDNEIASTTIYQPNGKDFSLTTNTFGNTTMYTKGKSFSINGNTISTKYISSSSYYRSGQGSFTASSTAVTANDVYFGITTVIGWKFTDINAISINHGIDNAAIVELLNRPYIVETGESQDGKWKWRIWNDDTMEMWLNDHVNATAVSFTSNKTTGVYSHDSYTGKSYTFPIRFESVPAVGGGSAQTNGYTIYQIAGCSETTVTVRLWDSYSSSPNIYYITGYFYGKLDKTQYTPTPNGVNSEAISALLSGPRKWQKYEDITYPISCGAVSSDFTTIAAANETLAGASEIIIEFGSQTGTTMMQKHFVRTEEETMKSDTYFFTLNGTDTSSELGSTYAGMLDIQVNFESGLIRARQLLKKTNATGYYIRAIYYLKDVDSSIKLAGDMRTKSESVTLASAGSSSKIATLDTLPEGTWAISCCVSFPQNNTGIRGAAINVNGNTTPAYARTNAAANISTALSMSTNVKVPKGETYDIELYAIQNSGSDLSVNYRYNAIPTSPVFVRNDVTQEWKLAGSALNGSTDWVTIPESATEVCVIMQGTTSSWDNTYRSSSPVIGLGDRWMIGGYYAGSSDYGYANVNIQNNGRSYQIRNHFYSSQNIKSSTNMYVYYKEADVDRLDHTNISVWQAEWIASSTSANGTSLTNSITVPAGTYIIVGQAPSASATTVCTLSGITPAKYFAIGDLGTFERICTLNSETTIKITSSQSASVTYSNLTRGGLTITKLA